jgi:Tfp pilus assembly protein PilX
MRAKTMHEKTNSERGVALLFALFTLLLLSAIAAALVFMTNTETSVNGNYRMERVSALASKAGMEEVRDRMAALTAAGQLPTTFPPNAGSVLYVLNEGAAAGTVRPWVAGNSYMDDELCHDFAGVQTTQPAPDVRCTTPPTSAMLVAGTGTTPITSTYPWNGTAAAVPYKWVRVTLKLSNSVQNYPVNAGSPTTQVCWNGATEILLSGALTCQTMAQSANPVYMITSMAVSTNGTTRKVMQAEVALPPAQPFPYGMFATGTACPAMTFSGGGNSDPATDSYNSKTGTYGVAGNVSDSGGDVGANGGVSMSGHSMVGGAIGVPSLAAAPPDPCVGGDLTTSGTAGVYNPGNSYPGNVPKVAGPYVFPTPPDPTPLPVASGPVPSTACVAPATGTCAVPGTYGAISLSGKNVLTLAPGVYNIYSLSLSGQSSITVNPPGAVVLNFPSTSASPISISGQGIASATNVPNDMQINYGGTGAVKLSGNGASYAVVDAPNAQLTVSGNGDFFGRVVGNTISYSGNGKFHFDTNTALGPQNSGIYQLISLREISY